MNRLIRSRQRLSGVFLLGTLLLFSPIVTLFDKATELAGIPISYLYLFGIWSILILLTAAAVRGRKQ